MNYRILPAEEFDKLKFIFEPHNLPLPDPSIERVAVAEDGDKIVGIIVLRLLPLIDGLWVEPKYRGGRVNYKKLIGTVEEPLAQIPRARAYAFGTGKHVKRIADECGYKPLEWTILEKVFEAPRIN